MGVPSECHTFSVVLLGQMEARRISRSLEGEVTQRKIIQAKFISLIRGT